MDNFFGVLFLLQEFSGAFDFSAMEFPFLRMLFGFVPLPLTFLPFVGPLSGGPSSVPSSPFFSIGSIKPVMPYCVGNDATAPKSRWFLSFGPSSGGPIVVGPPSSRPTTVGPPSGEPSLVILSRFSSVGPLSSVPMSLVPSSRFYSVGSVRPQAVHQPRSDPPVVNPHWYHLAAL